MRPRMPVPMRGGPATGPLNAEDPPVAGPPRHSTSLVSPWYPPTRDLTSFFANRWGRARSPPPLAGRGRAALGLAGRAGARRRLEPGAEDAPALAARAGQ